MILTFVMILTVIIFLTADDLLKTHAPNIPEINRIMLSGFAGLIACMYLLKTYAPNVSPDIRKITSVFVAVMICILLIWLEG